MVKRKDPLSDKKEKIKHDVSVRKVSKKTNFEEMYDAFTVEKPLIPLKHENVFFERKKEGKIIVCAGMFFSHYADGTVHIWDETHQEFWGFNHKKDLQLVRVRVPYLPTEGFQQPQKDQEKVSSPTQNDVFDEHQASHVESEDGSLQQDDSKVEQQQLKFKLWVDDERNPPDDTWVIARSTQEALDLVKSIGGLPHVMSLDHDLGLKSDGSEDKIIHLLTELEEKYKNWPVPEYVVHSQNPIGRANTIAFMETWKKSRES